MEEEEESSGPCVECEVPRELLLHRDQLMPPLEIGFEWSWGEYLDNATIPDQEEEQWNSTLVLQDVIVSKENSNHGLV